MDNKTAIGNTADVSFNQLGQNTIQCKIDTGATTSSLHATNISVNGNRVTFTCDEISPNSIQLDMVGQQDVKSADGGTSARPVVKLDITIGDKQLPDMEFNLNDRSNMDIPVLIGQNILQAGGFVVDVSQNQAPMHEDVDMSAKVLEAVKTLVSANVSFEQLVEMLRTEAVLRIKE